MSQQVFSSLHKSKGVGQLRVKVEGGLIDPLRVNRKHARFADGLKGADRQATNFRARGLDHPQHLLPELHFLPRMRLKMNEKVKGLLHTFFRMLLDNISEVRP